MRRGTIVFAVCCTTTLVFLVHSVWTLLTLLVIDGSQDAILASDIAHPGPQLIPKIIHQTYKNTSIPAVWQDAQHSCLLQHRDWEYKFWTDESSEHFIAGEYPWFLKTFRGYEYDIQRADAIRYFALAHFGGIYLDLDDGCNRPLEPLLQFPAWVRKTTPTGISNDVMGAAKGHPFFMRVIKELQKHDDSWLSAYITVMASTGPLFLSLIWRHWSAAGSNHGEGRVRILLKDEYMGRMSSFFVHHTGNSWHRSDVHLITWLHQNWIPLTAVCVLGATAALVGVWTLCNRCVPDSGELRLRKRSPSLLMPNWLSSQQLVYEKMERHDV